jgi:hypothetical protein
MLIEDDVELPREPNVSLEWHRDNVSSPAERSRAGLKKEEEEEERSKRGIGGKRI